MKKNLPVTNVTSKDFEHDYLKNIQKQMDCPSCLKTLHGELVISRNKRTWKCDKCGYSLSDRKLAQDYIFWFCDECGKFLNNQKGFRKNAKRFVCKNCGYKNKLTEENVVENIENFLLLRNNFTKKQIKFMHSIGLRMDFNNLSDEDWVHIEETVADYLETKCFDKDYNPTEDGLMCESILDNLPI